MRASFQTRTQQFLTVGRYLNQIAQRLEEAGIESPRLDARIMVSHVLRMEPSEVFLRSNDRIDLALQDNINALVERRLAKEPVSRITGKREFWGLSFELSADTLDPRPDTETLVEVVLEMKANFADRPIKILDLGTGTGCILLALLNECPKASGVGIDVSAGAVSVARSNAQRLGLSDRAKFAVADWADGIKDEFDIVVSNPPYVAEVDRNTLPEDVERYDPSTALFGGSDGFDAYHTLIPEVNRVLCPSGFCAIEVGVDQAGTVSEMMRSAGFDILDHRYDLSGIVRCIVGRPI